jgi:DNA invertase Pin-like site-specific DNA recombinase
MTQAVGFRSLQESINTTTPGGKLVFHIFAPWPSSNAT